MSLSRRLQQEQIVSTRQYEQSEHQDESTAISEQDESTTDFAESNERYDSHSSCVKANLLGLNNHFPKHFHAYPVAYMSPHPLPIHVS
jgi:hypothetical protein